MAEARDRALNEIATLKEDFIETLDSLELTEDRKDIVSRAMKDLSKVFFSLILLYGRNITLNSPSIFFLVRIMKTYLIF